MFNSGDIVRCIDPTRSFIKGNLYTVEKFIGDFIVLQEIGEELAVLPNRFELVVKAEHIALTEKEIHKNVLMNHYVNLHDIQGLISFDDYNLVGDSIIFAMNLVQKEIDSL